MASRAEVGGGIVDTIKTVAYALLIAGLFRTLFFQPFWIPSGSMKDTLLIGDFLFVNKMAYGYSRYSCPLDLCPFSGRILASEPKRGDVVVFHHPKQDADFIKRLIGLPGDTVEMRDGRLFVNGTAVSETAAGIFTEPYDRQGPIGSLPRCANSPVERGADCNKARFREVLPNGVVHDILKIDQGGPANNTLVFTVPAGEYFFMGDNRDNSEDSRFGQDEGGVGFVKFENLVGRADRIVFSAAGRSMLYFWTWRADRFLKAVQ